MTTKKTLYLIVLLGLLGACDKDSHSTGVNRGEAAGNQRAEQGEDERPESVSQNRGFKTVHVFVALCDNRHQGIVPVPDSLGNGQEPSGNLYWGAMYGVKTFFKQSPDWSILDGWSEPEREIILERVVFRGEFQGRQTYVLAEAYDGAHMKAALTDFFNAAAGGKANEVVINEKQESFRLQAGGLSDMVCFVGHNGLMDIRLEQVAAGGSRANPKWAVVLACKSRDYFSSPLKRAGCKPILSTTGLMAPEAYSLEAIVRSWSQNASAEVILKQAAQAYARYQRCSLKAAERLFWLEP